MPTSLAAQLKVKRGCTLTANRKVESTDDHEMTVKCSPNGEGTYVLHLSVRAPYTEISGLETISEGEREYHIVYLPKRLTSTFLVGFGHPTPFPRNVTITSSKRLRLFGHGLSSNVKFVSERSEKNKTRSDLDRSIKDQDKKTNERISLKWSSNRSAQ